jgi:PITH domain
LIKLLVNRNAIGFEDVEDAEEPEVAQILEISEDAIKEGRQIDLRFVRFQSVNSLHVSTKLRIAFTGNLNGRVVLSDFRLLESWRRGNDSS